MTQSWSTFEQKVRAVASHVWSGDCRSAHIGGVDVDGVMILADDAQIFIEITEERSLNKVREDILKLRTARDAYFLEKQTLPRCYCVVNGNITQSMTEAGKPYNIKVLSFDDFSNIFFNFEKYRQARDQVAFGSAVNPLTGAKDSREYINVTYLIDGSNKEIGIADIAKIVSNGKRVVLLGEYGTGKSRCFREVFKALAREAAARSLYPIAIDLRESWGLKRAREIVARHFDDLGLEESLAKAAVRTLNAGRAIFLLDGFDELGSQAWSNDSDKLRAIRAKSLEGVRDLIDKHCGVIISGREHYFNSNSEMFSALGLDETKTVIIRCKDEFSKSELSEYFQRNSLDIELPDWLPRRPLICQTIAEMSAEELDQIFGIGQEELGFWDHFIDVICKRDAKIHASFDAETIRRVLTFLARVTRSRAANVGPITLADVQTAFEYVVGQMPVEEASLMLQRLPALGRVKAESNDRQFIDTYILDGLRANDVGAMISAVDDAASQALNTLYLNPLDELGQRILARDIEKNPKRALALAKRSATSKNRVICCDIVASFMTEENQNIDFDNLSIDGGHFNLLDLSKSVAMNIRIARSTFGVLVLPSSVPPHTSIEDCLAERVVGIAAPTALPEWVKQLSADRYDSVESVSRIRKIGLSPAQEILVIIVRKTFFQKGAGRKEEALLRGLDQLASKRVAEKIVNLLLKEKMLSPIKGSEGTVYVPNRKYAGRMKQMLYELKTSQDEIWKAMDAIS